jgi:dihydrofolate reductase
MRSAVARPIVLRQTRLVSPSYKLIAIAAMAANRVIGIDGKLPWHLPEDLKFFKQTTLGHPVLMGRKTFESILASLGKPLPGRLNLVLSRTLPERADVKVIRDLDELASMPELKSPIYLIGGSQLYASLLPACDEILLTEIATDYEGDSYFPEFESLFDEGATLQEGEGFKIRRYSRRL